jgi:hypothetical protein
MTKPQAPPSERLTPKEQLRLSWEVADAENRLLRSEVAELKATVEAL